MRQIRKDFYFYSKLANVINEFLIPFVLIGIIVMMFCGVSISVKAYTGIFVATMIVELATVGAYGVLFIKKLKKMYPTANDFVDAQKNCGATVPERIVKALERYYEIGFMGPSLQYYLNVKVAFPDEKLAFMQKQRLMLSNLYFKNFMLLLILTVGFIVTW